MTLKQDRVSMSLADQPMIFVATIALTVWFAHFWGCREFGLYEDDFLFTGLSINRPLPEVWQQFMANLGYLQGRPLGFGLAYVFSAIGHRMAGLAGIYLISYGIVTANVILFYLLCKRCFSDSYAKIATLTYALFPADTTRAFLTHGLILQPSVTFLLIGLLCFLSRRYVAAYLCAAASLTCYELVFPVFSLAPLLQMQADRPRPATSNSSPHPAARTATRQQSMKTRWWLLWLRHLAILVGLCVMAYLFRKLTQEGRVETLSGAASGWTMALVSSGKNMLYGPINAIRLFLLRPIYALTHWGRSQPDWAAYGVVVLYLTLFSFWFLKIQRELQSSQSHQLTTTISTSLLPIELPETLRETLTGIGIGTLGMIVGYLLSFTFQLPIEGGRPSRVHLAGAIGGSLALGGCCWLLLYGLGHFRQRLLRSLLSGTMAMFFTLLLIFGLLVQQDYKVSWQFQRRFWTQVVQICPDLADGTVVILEADQIPRHQGFIESLAWPVPFILQNIYHFPAQWRSSPRVWVFDRTWLLQLQAVDHQNFKLQAPPWFEIFREVGLRSGNVILLQLRGDQVIRLVGTIPTPSQPLVLKVPTPSDPPPPVFPPKPLYHYLIESES